MSGEESDTQREDAMREKARLACRAQLTTFSCVLVQPPKSCEEHSRRGCQAIGGPIVSREKKVLCPRAQGFLR